MISLMSLVITPLCALYQRKKGRDLFDLHQVINNFPSKQWGFCK